MATSLGAGRIPEADDEHGDVVRGVIAVCVVEQLVGRLLRVRDVAHDVDRALVVHDIPELWRVSAQTHGGDESGNGSDVPRRMRES